MEELIAKRYTKAIFDGANAKTVKNIAVVFSTLADSFKNDRFVSIMDNPYVSADEKSKILLDSVEAVKSKEITNFIKLIVENKRINIIPAIAEEMRKNVATSTKIYEGKIYSNDKIDAKVIAELSKGLGNKFDAKISLVSVKNDFDGIKVDVEDLGVEINFSRSRINSQMIEHIIKAI